MGMYTLRLVFLIDEELDARKRAEVELGNLRNVSARRQVADDSQNAGWNEG